MNNSATVFVIDDDPAICKSLRRLFESSHLHVRTFGRAREFLAVFDPVEPGCVVLEVRLPGMSGLDLLEHLATHEITIPVIVVTGYADVAMAVRAMKYGAVDFIEKPHNDQVLLDGVQRAIERHAHIRRKHAERTEIALREARLTPRERQVMDLVVAGRANKQVAAEIGCSVKTVEVHRSRVMEKMEADSVATLVRMALTVAHKAGKR